MRALPHISSFDALPVSAFERRRMNSPLARVARICASRSLFASRASWVMRPSLRATLSSSGAVKFPNSKSGSRRKNGQNDSPLSAIPLSTRTYSSRSASITTVLKTHGGGTGTAGPANLDVRGLRLRQNERFSSGPRKESRQRRCPEWSGSRCRKGRIQHKRTLRATYSEWAGKTVSSRLIATVRLGRSRTAPQRLLFFKSLNWVPECHRSIFRVSGVVCLVGWRPLGEKGHAPSTDSEAASDTASRGWLTDPIYPSAANAACRLTISRLRGVAFLH